MIDRLGFSLVPWTPSLEMEPGRQLAGVIIPSDDADWSFGRKRGIGL
jgi:hypothetical protein